MNTLITTAENDDTATNPQFSDDQLVGGSGYTVRFSPNLSEEAQSIITKVFDGGCDEGYSVDELLAECTAPLGALCSVLSKDDLAIINLIKEDYIVFG